MNLKINWGWGIAIFLMLFVGTILVRIYIAYQQQINLVTPEYYPKGIAYEEEINKKSNYASLTQKLILNQTADSVIVEIPGKSKSSPMSGEILVYRPADFEDDSLYTFSFPDSLRKINIPKDFMKKGLYYIKVDWIEDSVGYYAEESIYINK